MPKIEYTKKPSSADISFITNRINEETSSMGHASPFAFFIRDDDSEIIAGANGFVIYGAVYTDQLWVDKLYIGQGYARKIMYKVHELGNREGCKIATVQTMSFQGAQGFYEKLGYTPEFRRTGYVNGSNCIFMSKSL